MVENELINSIAFGDNECSNETIKFVNKQNRLQEKGCKTLYT